MCEELVSVILPTYNVEKYMAQCLESIIEQTYKKIEIVIIIDGATDRSKEIAEQYAENDNRIKIVCQENSGSGPARNNGVQHAEGKYIVFVDPDDWIEKDLVEKLMEQQDGTIDLVLSGTINVVCTEEKVLSVKRQIPYYEKMKNAEEVHQAYLRLFQDELICAPTKKLYKKDIIEKYNIKFPELRRSQDIVFNYRYVDCVGNLLVIPYAGYNYRIIPKERMLRLKEDYYKTVELIYNDVKKLCCKWHVSLEKSRLENVYLYMFVACFEANVLANKSIKPLLENETLREVFDKSTNSRLDNRMLRLAVRNNWEWLIYLTMKVKYVIKKMLKYK